MRYPSIRSAVLSLSALTLLVAAGSAKKSGILPTSTLPLTRTANASCGSCHGGVPGAVAVSVVPSARVLAAGQSVTVTVKGTGGPSGSAGGFAADVSRGTFVAGSNTQVSASGNAITHASSSARSWTFGYKAPAETGLVELYAVVNSVNGDGKSSGDRWAFHGSSPTNTTSTPVRMFVNGAGVVPIGNGCADGYGNVGVYGAAQVPSVGNTKFKLEGHGLPPSARLLFILGFQKTLPSVDLGFMGAPGCYLHSDMAIEVYVGTSSGTAQYSDGRFILPAPIPNDATFKGFFFRTQLAAVDASPSARTLPVIFTNGLGITVQ